MARSGPKKSPRRSRRITPIGKAMKSQDGGFSLFRKAATVAPSPPGASPGSANTTKKLLDAAGVMDKTGEGIKGSVLRASAEVA